MFPSRKTWLVAFALITSTRVAHSEDITASLHHAMRTRISVSTEQKTGKTIPAAHCRHAAEGCDKRLAAFAEYLVGASQRAGVDPWLMAAVAIKESGLNPFAVGSAGEMGILQLNPASKNARDVRFMEDENYRRRCRKEPGACQRELVDRAALAMARAIALCSGDVKEALGAYNTGRCGGNKTYAKRILEERELLLGDRAGTADPRTARL
jgi:hypothetical protein